MTQCFVTKCIEDNGNTESSNRLVPGTFLEDWLLSEDL
jgi:hypothetical protein